MRAWHRLYRKNPGVGGTHLSSSSASSSAAPWKKFAATATVLQWPHWFHKLTFCPPRCSLWHLQGPHRCHNQLPIASASPQTVLNFTLLCFWTLRDKIEIMAMASSFLWFGNVWQLLCFAIFPSTCLCHLKTWKTCSPTVEASPWTF